MTQKVSTRITVKAGGTLVQEPPSFRKAFRWILVAALALSVNIFVYSSYLGRHIADHVYLGEVAVGGMTEQEVLPVIESYHRQYKDLEVVIRDEEHEVVLHAPDIGIVFDRDQTLAMLFRAGRSWWFGQGKASLLDTDKESIVVLPKLKVNRAELLETVREKLARREIDPISHGIDWSADRGWFIVASQSGRRLLDGEAERIVDGIIKGIYDPRSPKTYQASYVSISPSRRSADLDAILNRLRVMERVPVEVNLDGVAYVINIAAEAPDWLEFDYETGATAFRAAKVADWVREFALKHDREPSTVTVTGIEEKDSEYKPGHKYKKAIVEGDMRSGRKISQEQLVVDILNVLDDTQQRKVSASLQVAGMTVLSRVPGIEFPSLISVGKSDYSHGNQANRVQNIETALRIQNGTIILPGESSSFNTVGGWVTYSKGYVDGQVIFGEALAKVAGGGVCQVSTTMFRALVNAGLPILQRRNHSWDVHYYRDVYGVDAAIYPPGGLDLAFRNDTPGPILVHAYNIPETETAYFELYGVSDGREVELLPYSNVKRGKGRTVVNKWIVKYADGSIDERDIVSSYDK